MAASLYVHATGRDFSEVTDKARDLMSQGFRAIRLQVEMPGQATYGTESDLQMHETVDGPLSPHNVFEPHDYARLAPRLFEHACGQLGDEVELLHDIHDLFLFRTIRSMGRGPRFEDVTGASSVRDSLSGRLWTIHSTVAENVTMARIVIAECKQEVSTFNPVPSRIDDFRIARGPAVLDYHRNVREEVGGALSVFDASDSVELVPTFAASANTSGGVLAQESFDRLSNEFLSSLADSGSVDAAYFSLHGAMQAENENDPEGYLLQEARRILGEQIPFVVSLDIHGILTDRMLEHSDAIVAYHTYPHVDFFETGARAANLLLSIMAGQARPVTARVKIPALARGDEMITETGSISECIQLAKTIEASESGLSAGVMWGNPFTDVPELRTNSFAVTNGDEAIATQHAINLANRFWNHHQKMQVPLTSLDEAVRQAAEVTSGTVVMMDAADATSSGASGDSNAIVCEAVRQGYRGRLLAPVVDPAAVQQAMAAGVGATIRTTVGGTLDPVRYQPLELQACVRSVSDGRFRSESFGWHWDAGHSAVLQSDNITLLVGTHPVSLFDRSWFYANGQNPQHFDMVVVKSPHCEPHMFADWCAKLINVDAPGATSANLRSLGHVTCGRPIFPLDEGVEFRPVVDVFRRK
jgi:microcystin degradation protein MlrC